MNTTNGDQEHKWDLIIDPRSDEEKVEDNTKPVENPRGDTLRTDIQGTDPYSEPGEASAEITEYLNRFKQFRDPSSMTDFEKGVDELGDQINEFHHEMEMDMNPA